VKSIDDLRPNAAVDYLAIRELVEPTHTADHSDAKSKMALFTEDKILLPVFGAGHRLQCLCRPRDSQQKRTIGDGFDIVRDLAFKG
jgi:hypothetical protein